MLEHRVWGQDWAGGGLKEKKALSDSKQSPVLMLGDRRKVSHLLAAV